MKVFIIHASAGAGHQKAAEAIYEQFRKPYPKEDVHIIDLLERANPFFRAAYTHGYSFLIKSLPHVWAFFFWLTDIIILRWVTRPIARMLNDFNLCGFKKFLLLNNPDLVISTHFLASEIAASLKQKNKIKSRLVTVITDFGVHPFWVAAGTDKYFVASDRTKEELEKMGVAGGKVLVSGIPVSQRFLKGFDRAALAQKFDINPGFFTVLLMTGSFGFGPLEKLAKGLSSENQVIVVCARNKKLFKRLLKLNLPNVKAFGFVDFPEELMAVSDVIISKPGGLSVAEILNIGLIPIFISAIPGQESINARTMAEYGVGFVPGNLRQIPELIRALKTEPGRMLEMKGRINALKKPFAARDICNAVC